MKSFRDKLLASSIFLVAISISVTAIILNHYAENMIIEQAQNKLLSIAATAASQLDAEALTKIDSKGDESTPEFARLKKLLLAIRDANRNSGNPISLIYTLFPSPKDPSIHLVGINAADEQIYMTRVGDVYHARAGLPADLSKPSISTGFLEDQWGSWLAAFAPIRTAEGRYIASLVVETPKEVAISRVKKIHHYALIALAIGLLLALFGGLFISAIVTRPLRLLKEGLLKVKDGNLDVTVDLKSRDEFGEIAATFNSMTAGLKERDTVKSAFARYVSQQVLDTVITSGKLPDVYGDRRKVTALFADIRGFTKLSENLPPERVVEILNEYFDKMVEIIFKHKGTIDKFMGDGIMVIFGAPVEDPFQEENAVKAAIEMQAEISKLSVQWCSQGGTGIRIGIGINSGNAVVGNIGSAKRMEYTAIGDTVNLASRLEHATKELGVDILISDYTFQAIRGLFPTRTIGEVAIYGRNQSVYAHAVTHPADENSAPHN